mmetsp:Transcript_19955/g.34404  ORF Transcript_19955/g.34404 Transcript_19955/m.34404 type:complete len:342 (+) Transcript_19955:71-1096(+)
MALSQDELKSEVKRCVPPLSADSWKGQAGKVGVLGGCTTYTGPPYFTAMAALKVGADLAHIFTTKAAAPIIKSYSPEIIVHPYLSETSDFLPGQLTEERCSSLVREAVAEVEAWFTRLDCLVVGPGLGRDPLLLDVARACIVRARLAGLPLVLDGDGLFLVAREPDLVIGYSACVLTPNLSEFRRLATTLGVSLHGPQNDRVKKLGEVTMQLAGPVVLSKGPVDAIHDSRKTVLCTATAGLRRCGGLGDILAGSVATFISWVLAFLERTKAAGDAGVLEMNPMILAAFGGCLTTRTTTAMAFTQKRRAMLASDVLELLGPTVDALFDSGGAFTEVEGRSVL